MADQQAIAGDPHEVDHSFTNDGNDHCRVCGLPSVDLEAREAGEAVSR